MDRLDFQVLGVLINNSRLSYEQIAATLHVDPEAVINRTFSMWDAGVISEYRVRVNPLLFGLKTAIVLAEAYRSYCKQKDVRALRTLENVSTIVETTSRIYSAYVLYPDEAGQKDTVDRIRGMISPSRVTSVLHPFEETPSVQLAGQDWKIIEYLLDDPRAAGDKMAADLGMSARTLARRLERLIDGGVIKPTVVVQPGMFRGMTSNRLYLLFKPGHEAARAEIVDSVGNQWNRLRLGSPDGYVVDVYGKTRKDIDDDLKFLKSRPEVRETFYTLPSRIVSNDLPLRRKVVEAVFSTQSLRDL